MTIRPDIFPSLALDHISLFPGILQTLSELKNRGIVMAIVSSRHHMSLDPLAEQLGVLQYIPRTRLYGEDESLAPKPAPDIALKILSDLNLNPAQTLVVGDTIYDLQMGSAAGCHTCGVTYGNQSRQKLLSVNPDHLIDTFPDLVALL